MNSKDIYIMYEINGKNIHSGYFIAKNDDKIFFDYQGELYSKEASTLYKPNATLDDAKREKLPSGNITGLVSNGSDVLLFLQQENNTKILKFNDSKWVELYSLETTSTIYSCISTNDIFFIESNPKSHSIIYRWNRDSGLSEFAKLNLSYKIYSIRVIKNTIQILINHPDGKVLEFYLEKNYEYNKKILSEKDFNSITLNFNPFKFINNNENVLLMSSDGESKIYDTTGKLVWSDIDLGNCGMQIATSACLSKNYNILGSWRKDKTHPMACIYFMDNLKTIYKHSTPAADLNNSKWTGYQLNCSLPIQNEIFIPCYGAGLIRIGKIKENEDLINSTIIYDSKNLTLIGRFQQAEEIYQNENKVKNNYRYYEKVFYNQNYYPNYKNKTRLYLTFDVEQHLPGLPYCITGGDLQTQPGIFWIMSQLEKFSLKGTFFINIYEFENFDNNFMNDLIVEIDKRGHEVGLHCHPSYSNTSKLSFNKKPLGDLTFEEQFKIIEFGRDFIKGILGKQPISFRSGAYSINNDTFKVLESLDFKIDSSIFISEMNAQKNLNYPTKNRITNISNIIEIPITSIILDDKLSKLDINWVNTSESLMNCLDSCKVSGLTNIVFMAHSFSFLNFTRKYENRISDFRFTRNRYISGINEELKMEFSKFLECISNNNYEVSILSDCCSLNKTDKGSDTIPIIYSTNNNEKICPICGNQSSFIDYRGRKNAQCSYCGSLERMRLKNLYLKKILQLNLSNDLTILHVGPHLVTSAWLRSLPNIDYISTDPYNNAEFKFPLENIPFTDNNFDIIICIGVFMHLLDDKKALKEIHRVLKPEGELVLWMGSLENDTTIEYYDSANFDIMLADDFSIPQNLNKPQIKCKGDKIYYNPRYGTRKYGKDLIKKLEGLGYTVRIIKAINISQEIEKYGIGKNDFLISCKKKILSSKF